MVLGALNMEFGSTTQPQEVLNRINRLLCEKSLSWQFVTLFVFVLSRYGRGQFISAGHNPSYLFRSATATIEQLGADAYPLGMFDSATFEPRAVHLDKGDILVVYSDGLTEAQNQQEEMLGEPRLLEIIRQEGPSGVQALERKILKAIDEF